MTTVAGRGPIDRDAISVGHCVCWGDWPNCSGWRPTGLGPPAGDSPWSPGSRPPPGKWVPPAWSSAGSLGRIVSRWGCRFHSGGQNVARRRHPRGTRPDPSSVPRQTRRSRPRRRVCRRLGTRRRARSAGPQGSFGRMLSPHEAHKLIERWAPLHRTAPSVRRGRRTG